MYNNVYFDKQPSSQSTSKDTFSYQIDKIALQPHELPVTPTTEEICREFDTNIDSLPPTELISHKRDGCKHKHIVASKSNIFFIKYTPEHTLHQRWYLIQVDLKTSLELIKD